jgi:hypothetical protein
MKILGPERSTNVTNLARLTYSFNSTTMINNLHQDDVKQFLLYIGIPKEYATPYAKKFNKEST